MRRWANSDNWLKNNWRVGRAGRRSVALQISALRSVPTPSYFLTLATGRCKTAPSGQASNGPDLRRQATVFQPVSQKTEDIG